MKADAEFAANLDFPQRPADECGDRADGDDLPQPAFEQRCCAKADLKRGRVDRDEPWIPCRALTGPVEYENCPKGGKKEPDYA